MEIIGVPKSYMYLLWFRRARKEFCSNIVISYVVKLLKITISHFYSFCMLFSFLLFYWNSSLLSHSTICSLFQDLFVPEHLVFIFVILYIRYILYFLLTLPFLYITFFLPIFLVFGSLFCYFYLFNFFPFKWNQWE